MTFCGVFNRNYRNGRHQFVLYSLIFYAIGVCKRTFNSNPSRCNIQEKAILDGCTPLIKHPSTF